MTTIREQVIAQFKADHNGAEPSGSMIRMIERYRVSELDPASEEAQRIRADIAERNAVTAEALRRWYSILREGLPLPMPSVARLEHIVRAERAAVR